ncbi:MAG: NUDIX domain-containing protein, partial [Candidatus Paceibacterota bacterium]
KLPGGGIEEGEDHETALRRECEEEIGCDVEVLGEIGMLVEYRKMFTLTQRSYCYLARVKGSKGVPHLEAGEIEDGFKEVWLTYDDAERAMTESVATNPEGLLYIVPRDTLLLREAKKHLG